MHIRRGGDGLRVNHRDLRRSVHRGPGPPVVLQCICRPFDRLYLQLGLLLETSGELDKFSIGDLVKVMDGPLKGTQGTLADRHNKYFFSIVLESIGQVITVQIDPKIIQKVP